MKKLILLLLLIPVLLKAQVQLDQAQIPSLDITKTSNLAPALNKQNIPYKYAGNYALSNGSTLLGSYTTIMGRMPLVTKNAISQIKIGFTPYQGFGGTAEALISSPQVIRASLEYGSSITPLQMTVNGSYDIVVYPNSRMILTDPTPLYIPAATTVYVREFKRVPTAPTSNAAALVAGGTLTVSTPYYYFLTTIDQVQNLESAPSASVTITPTTGNQSASITWVRNIYAQAVKVYRSTTNTASSAQYIGTITDPNQSFIDNGINAVAINPPSNVALFADGYCINSGYSQTYAAADLTASTGALGQVGPLSAFTVFPTAVFADDLANEGIAIFGDSISLGVGFPISQGVGAISRELNNWGSAGIIANGTYNSMNVSIASRKLYIFMTNALKYNTTNDILPWADYIVNSNGHNDLSVSQTWQQLAINQNNFAQIATRKGQRVIVTTIPPTTTSTDGFVTAGNQTVTSYEAARLNYNAWVRAGSQFSSGTPVLSSGTPSQYIYNYFDLAAPVEVNSSNVLTQNGGFIIAPSAATFTGQVITGSPTLTSLSVSGTPYTANGQGIQGLVTYLVKITSGTANNQTAIISGNTTSTLTLYPNASTSLTGISITGLTTIPAAGDTFSIYPVYTADGIHFSLSANALIATSFSTWVGTNIAKFGGALVK